MSYRELSDEQLLAIAAEQDYGEEDPKCVLRLMRAVIAADRQCDAQAVGEIVANDPMHGWHMRALKPWSEIGEGTLLYAGLPPRVTQSMVDAQSGIIGQLEKSQERMDAMREKYGVTDDQAADAARYQWLKARFTGYDFYWMGKPPYEDEADKGKCVIVFECGQDFNAGRDFERAIDAALSCAQVGTGEDR